MKLNEAKTWEVAEVKLVYKSKTPKADCPVVRGSEDCHSIFKASWDMETIELYEQCKILLVDRSNRCMALLQVSQGGVSGANIDPRLVFIAALRKRATGIVLCHNHPAGSLKASDSDRQITKDFCKIGGMLGIRILDHLIITREGFFSFANEGLL